MEGKRDLTGAFMTMQATLERIHFFTEKQLLLYKVLLSFFPPFFSSLFFSLLLPLLLPSSLLLSSLLFFSPSLPSCSSLPLLPLLFPQSGSPILRQPPRTKQEIGQYFKKRYAMEEEGLRLVIKATKGSREGSREAREGGSELGKSWEEILSVSEASLLSQHAAVSALLEKTQEPLKDLDAAVKKVKADRDRCLKQLKASYVLHTKVPFFPPCLLIELLFVY